ncbi:hypothetical protein CALCODRAFT_538884 [Calocera cornea HHB12733]|uniref:Uncharacterized protein n=1 Tax=Calocera cornea HHB12733 TaxID=1353952 RepID=A0A165GWV4_9BASI|nr:hypothetical protein CALCODRAFT_538884 [Calocera cornea HHB12733]
MGSYSTLYEIMTDTSKIWAERQLPTSDGRTANAQHVGATCQQPTLQEADVIFTPNGHPTLTHTMRVQTNNHPSRGAARSGVSSQLKIANTGGGVSSQLTADDNGGGLKIANTGGGVSSQLNADDNGGGVSSQLKIASGTPTIVRDEQSVLHYKRGWSTDQATLEFNRDVAWSKGARLTKAVVDLVAAPTDLLFGHAKENHIVHLPNDRSNEELSYYWGAPGGPVPGQPGVYFVDDLDIKNYNRAIAYLRGDHLPYFWGAPGDEIPGQPGNHFVDEEDINNYNRAVAYLKGASMAQATVDFFYLPGDVVYDSLKAMSHLCAITFHHIKIACLGA